MWKISSEYQKDTMKESDFKNYIELNGSKIVFKH